MALRKLYLNGKDGDETGYQGTQSNTARRYSQLRSLGQRERAERDRLLNASMQRMR